MLTKTAVLKSCAVAALIVAGLGTAGAATVCDFAPSKLVGELGASATAGFSAATAATGIGMKAAGLYSLQNAATGAWMLGSTAAGGSAAGTVGILGGTAGGVGAIGATLLAPEVIVAGLAVAAGVGVYEGACYLARQPGKK